MELERKQANAAHRQGQKLRLHIAVEIQWREPTLRCLQIEVDVT